MSYNDLRSMQREQRHRLFAGCPIDPDVAESVSTWAKGAFTDGGVRVVPAENLHVTLLFYPSVDSEARETLVALAGQVAWEPVPVATGKILAMGRSAIAIQLETERGNLPWTEALAQMARLQGAQELGRMEGRQRNRRSLALHVTVARTRRPMDLALIPPPPRLAFLLDAFCLFESHLTASGPIYESLTCRRTLSAH